MNFATTKNLTILGIITILQALSVAGQAAFDGDPSTAIDLNIFFTQIATGIGLIMAKGSANTGGTVPSTPEAASRLVVKAGVAIMLAFALISPAGAQEPAPAPEVRWSFQIGKLTIAPSVSFTPTVVSLTDLLDGDLTLSTGPNVGAGMDVTETRGYGGALHLTRRDTADGAKPLISLYAIIPALAHYGLRPGVSYQFGGGAAPWKDGVLLGIAGATNFGFTGG